MASPSSIHVAASSLALVAGLAAQAVPPESEVSAFVQQWCVQCHASPEPEADLDLVAWLLQPRRDAATLRALREQLENGDMPPEDEPQPSRAAVDQVLAWVRAQERPVVATPGRVTVRRLSRYEYDNVVRDLFGVRTPLSERFPGGDLGAGFDNIGDALSFSTLHLETFAAAAADVAARVVVTEDPARPAVRHVEAESMECTIGERARGDFAELVSSGELAQAFELPRQGRYRVRVRAGADQAGDEPARMAVTVGDAVSEEVPVPQGPGAPQIWEHELQLPGGACRLGVAFVNDYYEPGNPDPQRRDRNLLVDWVELVGPLDAPALSFGHRWLFAVDRGRGQPLSRARPIVRQLIRHAWRRPPLPAETERLAGLIADAVAAGDSFAQGVRLAVQAALVSLHFLFRIEPQPAATAEETSEDVDDFALASRLSFFLWSSTPDEALLQLSKRGQLRDVAVLRAQVQRLLADARASALSESFAGQWLELRRLDDAHPDAGRFPDFDDALRADMRRESELLFESVLREQRDVRQLLDADYTFLNERLAAHYGIDGVVGTHFRRVRLAVDERRGLLGHASVLTVTSNPTRTSPVKRGKWIMENLLDDPPPPPPPGSDSFNAEQVGHLPTVREMLAVHRADPKCAVCHRRMDAFGLTLEHFDAVGRWRDDEAGAPIDAAVSLGETSLEGVDGLVRYLHDGDRFVRGLTRRLFVYAVGRAVAPADEPVLEALLRGLPAAPTLADLILAIVQLDAFRRRDVVR